MAVRPYHPEDGQGGGLYGAEGRQLQKHSASQASDIRMSGPNVDEFVVPSSSSVSIAWPSPFTKRTFGVRLGRAVD